MAGSCNLRFAPGDGRVGWLDHRAQERAFNLALLGSVACLRTVHWVLGYERSFRNQVQRFCAAGRLFLSLVPIPGCDVCQDDSVFIPGGASTTCLVETWTASVAGGYGADMALLFIEHRARVGDLLG